MNWYNWKKINRMADALIPNQSNPLSLPPEPEEPELEESSEVIQLKTVILSSEQIKNGFSNPITLFSEIGAGKIISIKDIVAKFATGSEYFNGQEFVRNDPFPVYNPLGLFIKSVNTNEVLFEDGYTIQTFEANSTYFMQLDLKPPATKRFYVENDSIIAYMNADSTLGNGTVTLYIYYSIITT